MCTSVPQMVVVVTRITASPARACGLGTSSTARWSLPLKTIAFIVSIVSLRFSPIFLVYSSLLLPGVSPIDLPHLQPKADDNEQDGSQRQEESAPPEGQLSDAALAVAIDVGHDLLA